MQDLINRLFKPAFAALPWAVSMAAVLALLVAARPAHAEDPVSPSLLGPVSRGQVEAAEPDWVAAEVDATIDEDAAKALAGVPPGAKVVVYFGTWCSDSRREVSRFWRALDVTGSEVPFELEYIAVDRGDKRPPEMKEELGLVYVPTFIVTRDGQEVGRMVEESPHGIENDLLALLEGDATGVISVRDDVGATTD
ncbi:MAG: thioredoxin family protein [Acidobacteria bacterium]|nr:thioredoxin family protein [Acidobacteriota bacterium]